MTPGIDPPPIDTIVRKHGELQNAKYLAVASCMLLIYDILIRLDDEISNIWSSRWTFARVMYHLNRLSPLCVLLINMIIFLAPSITPSECKTTIHIYTYGCNICSAIISVTVIARCWVLFGQEPYVLTLLLIGLASFFVPSTIILSNQIENLTYLPNTLPEVFSGCVIITHSSNSWLPYIFPFIFESVVFVATVWRTKKLMREFGPMPLTRQLLKDGSLFYAVILIAVLFTCIGATIPSVELAAVASGAYTAFGSVMCNRLICSLYTFGGPATISTVTQDTLGRFGLGIPMTTLQNGGTTLNEPEPEQSGHKDRYLA